jgi:hypothetical protein
MAPEATIILNKINKLRNCDDLKLKDLFSNSYCSNIILHSCEPQHMLLKRAYKRVHFSFWIVEKICGLTKNGYHISETCSMTINRNRCEVISNLQRAMHPKILGICKHGEHIGKER